MIPPENPSKHKTLSDWVHLYSDDLFQRAFHRTSDKEAAEDLVQETFISAFKAIENFRSDSKARTWLFSILNNKINDHHRAKFKKVVLNESEFVGSKAFDDNGSWMDAVSPSKWDELEGALLDQQEFRAVLESCLADLPEKWNLALLNKFMEEKTAEEICQELNISPSNYWQMLHRAKVQLRICIQNNWFNS